MKKGQTENSNYPAHRLVLVPDIQDVVVCLRLQLSASILALFRGGLCPLGIQCLLPRFDAVLRPFRREIKSDDPQPPTGRNNKHRGTSAPG